ncbi:MAG: biliverdin-producing heme oxygenase [Chryseolinea sp.]
MDLIQQLRSETESDHRALEKDLVKKIKAVRTSTDYIDLLRLMHGFYAAMEGQLQDYLSHDAALDFYARRKADWLITDMETVGGIEDVRYCPIVPEVDSFSSALGAMYVLEGSTLGGQIIAKMLKQQLGKDSDEGLTFFLSYGPQTAAMWNRFKSYLDKPFDDRERTEVVRGAKETFTSFRKWIERYELEKA